MIRTGYGIPAHDGVGDGAAENYSAAVAVTAAAVAAAAVAVGVEP